jgi:hypothetical protein
VFPVFSAFPLVIVVNSMDIFQTTVTVVNIVATLVKYGRQVREAPKELAAIHEELLALTALRESLSSGSSLAPPPLPSGLSLSDTFSSLTNIWKCMEDCLSSATKLKGLGLLKWPFKSTDVKVLLERIHRYRGILDSIIQLQQRYTYCSLLILARKLLVLGMRVGISTAKSMKFISSSQVPDSLVALI